MHSCSRPRAVTRLALRPVAVAIAGVASFTLSRVATAAPPDDVYPPAVVPPPPVAPPPLAPPPPVAPPPAVVVVTEAPPLPPIVDARAPSPKPRPPKADWFLHGFRLGYMYMNDIEGLGGGKDSTAVDYKKQIGIRSPHTFLLGYELTQRLVGHSWLNILFVENVMIAGIDQSRILPSGNVLLGFEFDERFQVGVGLSATPVEEKAAHMIVAAGWTPRVGSFYTPVHAFFVPDVDGQYRTGATVGVNW